MSFGVYKNTEILEPLMNDPETSLTLSFDSLSSECGYSDIEFNLDDELEFLLTSEVTSESELVISSNLSDPLNFSLDGLCMEGSYPVGELFLTADPGSGLEDTVECEAAQESLNGTLGDSQNLSVVFLNEGEDIIL